MFWIARDSVAFHNHRRLCFTHLMRLRKNDCAVDRRRSLHNVIQSWWVWRENECKAIDIEQWTKNSPLQHSSLNESGMRTATIHHSCLSTVLEEACKPGQCKLVNSSWKQLCKEASMPHLVKHFLLVKKITPAYMERSVDSLHYCTSQPCCQAVPLHFLNRGFDPDCCGERKADCLLWLIRSITLLTTKQLVDSCWGQIGLSVWETGTTSALFHAFGDSERPKLRLERQMGLHANPLVHAI